MTLLQIIISAALFIGSGICLQKGFKAYKKARFYKTRIYELEVINEILRRIEQDKEGKQHFVFPGSKEQYIDQLMDRIQEIFAEMKEYEMRGKEKV